jgi:anaerobic nitric oxide reductase flavorubredoxin
VARVETINDGIREMWNPDDDAIVRCKDFGKSIGEIIG